MLKRVSGMTKKRAAHQHGPELEGLVAVLVVVLTPEPLDPSSGVDELLLPGEKRMATRADFDVNLFDR
jgi:hypothetical protein